MIEFRGMEVADDWPEQLADLHHVAVAPRTDPSVRTHRRVRRGRHLSVAVRRSQLDHLGAGELGVPGRRPGLGAPEQEHGGGRDQSGEQPPGAVDADDLGQPAEGQCGRDERQPDHRARSRGDARSHVGRDRIVQALRGVEADERQGQ